MKSISPLCRALAVVVPLALAQAHAGQVCVLHPMANDSPADDTRLLQQGIDDCAKQGGGTLKLDARVYTTGPIQLRSHVYLELAADTVIQGTADQQRYVPAFIGWRYRANEALISGYQITDSGIVGSGRIDGQGSTWWEQARRQRKDGTMTRLYPALPDANGMPRPWLVEFYDSTQIRVDGPTLQNAPMWNLAVRYSQGIDIQNLTIRNPKDSPNTDGIDIISSQKVHIAHADIATGDDNITIKSGLAGFDVPAMAASDIRIEHVKLGSGHGISMGSETLNGIHHVIADDAQFDGTDNGFRIKTGRDRGNDIAHITLRNVQMHGVDMALSVSAYYPDVPAVRDAAQPITATTPHIHDVQIENLTADGVKTAGRFIGLPESPLRNISLSRVHIEAESGITWRDVSAQTSDLKVLVQHGPAWIEKEDAQIARP
jgi:polygalacturonase